jgi:hypothetical protein
MAAGRFGFADERAANPVRKFSRGRRMIYRDTSAIIFRLAGGNSAENKSLIY